MNDLSKLAIPRVNMNGASRNVLLEDLRKATDELTRAYVALANCEYAHGREFQTVGDPAIGRLAQDQHRARLRAILDVKAELNYLAEQIYAQGGTERQPVKLHGHAQSCDHGSSSCISHFLSEKNWSKRTIREYLGIAEDVTEHVANNGSTHPERQDKLPLKAAVAKESHLPERKIRYSEVQS